MSLDAKHIHRVCVHQTAGTAHPAIGGVGTNIAQATWSGDGFDTIGSKQLDSDDHDFDSEAIDLVLASISTPIRAPRDLAPQGYRYEGGTLEDFEFSCFGFPEALVALSSNMTIASNAARPATSRTKRTLVIEINGHGLLYMPQAYMDVQGIPMGYIGEDVMKATFRVQLETDDTLVGGFDYEWRQ